MKETPQAPVFSIAELAKRWRVQRQSISRQIQTAQLPAFRIGKQWRVTEETVRDIENGRLQNEQQEAA